MADQGLNSIYSFTPHDWQRGFAWNLPVEMTSIQQGDWQDAQGNWHDGNRLWSVTGNHVGTNPSAEVPFYLASDQSGEFDYESQGSAFPYFLSPVADVTAPFLPANGAQQTNGEWKYSPTSGNLKQIIFQDWNHDSYDTRRLWLRTPFLE